MERPVVFITRRATFAAAHRLYDPKLDEKKNLELFGKCSNLGGHGHNYILEVTLCGPVDPSTGILLNLADLKRIIEERILTHVDHKNLNNDVSFLHELMPTVENLSIAFWHRLVEALPKDLLYEVKLIETENNWASYRGGMTIIGSSNVESVLQP